MAIHRSGAASDDAINTAFYLAAVLVLALIAWGAWRVWDDLTSPTYRIRKDQWTCTASRTRKFAMMDGRYGTVRTSTQTTCDQYTRNGH